MQAAASAQRARRVRPGQQGLLARQACMHSSSPRAIPSANFSVARARSLSPSPVLAARSKSRQLPKSNSASCISGSGPAIALCLRQSSYRKVQHAELTAISCSELVCINKWRSIDGVEQGMGPHSGASNGVHPGGT